MKCLVTGAAGFLGAQLCEQLLHHHHTVIGLDAFLPSYPRAVKEANLASFRGHPAFRFHPLDLRCAPLDEVMAGVEAIFHLAAMPGWTPSWADFDLYESCNITATQRLLEAARGLPNLQRFLFASTSSVYGRHACGDETLPARPISPYGVTKLASEHLCRAYAEEYALPMVVLRYFSVYGPGQRPDMAYHRFIDALLHDQPIVLHGDGWQSRGNTYVTDCVAATMLALQAPVGEVYNVGGSESANLWEILKKLERITGRQAIVRREPARCGDQRVTAANTAKLHRHLGWRPQVRLDEGLAKQVAWQQSQPRRQAA
jgi:nucleoside-diphosphate-sugar epimerase